MLNVNSLTKQFSRMGAHLVILQTAASRGRPFDLNVLTDRHRREFFQLRVDSDELEMDVLQVDPKIRHLLLHVNNDGDREKFLCGHDERHWFAASINRSATSIVEAKRSLMPQVFQPANLPAEIVNRRHTPVFLRQGEWFFVREVPPSVAVIHRNEPIVRVGGGKPHVCSELVRFGGTQVILHRGQEFTESAWAAQQKLSGFKLMGRVERRVKDPVVYVRGPVRHPDHATLVLKEWHRVYGNMEARTVNLTFYD